MVTELYEYPHQCRSGEGDAARRDRRVAEGDGRPDAAPDPARDAERREMRDGPPGGDGMQPSERLEAPGDPPEGGPGRLPARGLERLLPHRRPGRLRDLWHRLRLAPAPARGPTGGPGAGPGGVPVEGTRKGKMNADILWFAAFLVLWVVLQQFVLPRLGVPQSGSPRP